MTTPADTIRDLQQKNRTLGARNEKLVELVNEYWGSPDQPREGDPDDPLLAFIGFWYRFPDDQ